MRQDATKTAPRTIRAIEPPWKNEFHDARVIGNEQLNAEDILNSAIMKKTNNNDEEQKYSITINFTGRNWKES